MDRKDRRSAARSRRRWDLAHLALGGRELPVQQCAVPGPPGSVTATAGTNIATVTWTPANGNGSALTAYIVRVATGPNVGESVATPGTATSASLSGLAGGSAASFTVAAESSCGTGPAVTSSAVTPAGSATTYATAALGAGPSLYYRLGEPAGATVMADSSGNNQDGSYSGEGVLGGPRALPTDPATSVSYTTCCGGVGTSPAIPPQFNDPRTVEVWLNTTSASNGPAIIGRGTRATDQAFVVGVEPSAVLVDGDSDSHLIPTGHTLADGTWHMLAVTYDGTTITAYLDGRPMGTALFNAPLDTLGGNLAIGGVTGYNDFGGSLQDLAIYPAALSGGQIAAQFAASGYSVPPAPVEVHVSFGGTNGATITWGEPTAPNATPTGYLVSVTAGPNSGQTVSVPGGATAARLYGLAAASQTFAVRPYNTFGTGTATSSQPFTPTGAGSTYAATVLADNPSVFYRLGDSTPTVMADSSGHAADGTYTAAHVTQGTTPPLPGDATTAVTTDTSGQGSGSAAATVPLYNSPRTVEAWINTTQTFTGGMTVVSWGTPGADNGFALNVFPGGITVDAGQDARTFATPYAINDGNWHLVTVTYNGKAITAYLDGLPIGSRQFSGALDTRPAPLTLGSSSWDSAPGYLGSSLADVAIYPTALTKAQIAAQFAASGYGRPGAPGSVTATGGQNSATVTWTAAGAPGATVSDYLVTALAGGKAAVNAQAVPGTATSATISGLDGGRAYRVRVVAQDPYGTGIPAASAQVTPAGAASTYASTVLADRPSVFYRLGDSSPTVMADSSGHAANGTYNAAGVTLGTAGPLRDDATTAAVAGTGSRGIGSAAATVPLHNAPRTVQAWINTTQTFTGGMTVASWGTSGADNGFALNVFPSGISVDAGLDARMFATPYAINDGNWHLVTVTYDGTTITAYIDGLPLGSRQFNGTPDTLPAPVTVGSSSWNSAPAYAGSSLADLAIYPTALTKAQVTVQFTASGYARPGAPGSVAARAAPNAATVTWTPASAPGTTVSGYLVTALAGGTAAVNAQAVPGTAGSATLTGLQGGHVYSFQVVALDPYGTGIPAASTQVTPTGAASTYASTVLADSPSVFYRLGDSTPAVLADSSGHAANGSYATGVTLGGAGAIIGDPATSITCNGNNGGSAFAGLPAYNQSRTVEAWVKTTGASTQAVVGWGSANTTRGFTLAVGPRVVVAQG
jgi:hypothetical protein